MSKVLINVVYAFTPLDIENPTKDFRRFLRDLTGYLEGETDKSGSSEADHMYDVDMGGGGAGAPLPGRGRTRRRNAATAARPVVESLRGLVQVHPVP
jgi:hypothetical protein